MKLTALKNQNPPPAAARLNHPGPGINNAPAFISLSNRKEPTRTAPFFLWLAFLGLSLSVGCASSGSLGAGDQKRVAGRTFVITGASSGFGRGTAVRLGSHKANVVLAARRTELLEEVAKEVRAAGGTPLVVTTDVSRPEDITRLARAAVARFGGIDAWVNNAGSGVITRFWDAPVEDYSRLVDINLKGVIYGSHAAVRQFRKQGYGTLVNIGSVDSEVPLAYQAAYSATKAGVLGLGRALNEEIRLSDVKNIKVATVLPWAADTPWWGHAANYSGGTPRMGAMDDPQKVVDTIVRACLHPKEEMPAGWKAKMSYASHRIMPNFTESFSANVAHRYQIATAPPAPATKGSLYEPMQSGRGVDDGVRARIKREEEQRRAQAGR